jgi:hypothetical protein
MKRYTLVLTLLLALVNTGCEDKKDDSFSIVGKWQKASKVESTGEWQPAGDIYDLKDSGNGVYYDEGKLDDPKPVSYTFDESTMFLIITRQYGKNEVRNYLITIETNDIIFWGDRAMKRIE